jgi:FO synthase
MRSEAEQLCATHGATPLAELMAAAAQLRDEGHGSRQTYSPKVFLPLTQLCRDVCHYCTFARPPCRGERAYMTRDEVLAVARSGAALGCREALFTLGDKPELRYRAARAELAALGHPSTLSYLREMCALVLEETGLLPHVNAGVMDEHDIVSLRAVSASQGLMLESVSERLCEPGGPHYRSPDKRPRPRLDTIAAAGRAGVPFTSGILIGIGETRLERIESLLALKALHERYGHIQEVIIQNFRAKPGTRMAGCAEPPLEELLWTIAVARMLLGPSMSLQAPPNLTTDYECLIAAGINDWGGISPVTPDHVNPEAPWPQLDELAERTARAGRVLLPRLTVYPAYAQAPTQWLSPSLRPHVWKQIDASGLARSDGWAPGLRVATPSLGHRVQAPVPAVARALERAAAGDALDEAAVVALFAAQGADVRRVCEAADRLRAERVGATVTYVVNRNINYTNVCSYKCSFCAFSRARGQASLRGPAYDLSLDEVQRRVREAAARGATEVCMQGGIHPAYTGNTYLELLAAVKQAVPGMHVHAFSPLEVQHGARTLGLSIEIFLRRLRDAGLGSLPGTAAEILDDEVRAVICPDKLNTAEWLSVVESAHRVGLRTTATIMFGHVEQPRHWARHLLRIREVQARTGGFTEFVPLPFVHMEAPMSLRGASRVGPTWRETVLMHAVARLVLDPVLSNIQASWVKLGPEGLRACLDAGVNDVGGTLMNESISRAAGTEHGQELPPDALAALIRAAGREPAQRTTLYAPVPVEAQGWRHAPPLSNVELTPLRRRTRGSSNTSAGGTDNWPSSRSSR